MDGDADVQVMRERGLGQILGDSLAMVARNALPLFGATAMFYLPIALLNGWLSGRWMTELMDISSSPSLAEDPELALDAMLNLFLSGDFLLLVLAWPLYLLLSTLAALAVMGMSLALREGRPGAFGHGLRALRRIVGYALMFVTQTFTILLLMLPVAVIMVLLAIGGGMLLGSLLGDTGSSGLWESAFVLILLLPLGLVALVLSLLPAFYVSARWMVSAPALVEEGIGPFAALRRSWALTRDHKLRSLGLHLSLSSAVIILTVAGSLFSTILSMSAAHLPPTFSSMASSLTNALVYMLIVPISSMVAVLFYDDLRARLQRVSQAGLSTVTTSGADSPT